MAARTLTKKKPITQSDLDMIARINAERFSASDLLELSREIHDLPDKLRDWEGRMFLLAKRFPHQPYRALAVDKRLEAMSALIATNTLPLGVMPQAQDGSHMVAESVFEAAAVEPLLYRGTLPFFEPESFLKRVLQLSETDGEA